MLSAPPLSAAVLVCSSCLQGSAYRSCLRGVGVRPRRRGSFRVPSSASKFAIAFAIHNATGVVPRGSSGASPAVVSKASSVLVENLPMRCFLQVLCDMKQSLHAPALVMLARNELPPVVMPQPENATAFEALLAAEIAAKL